MKRKGSLRYYAEGDVLYCFIKAGEEAESVEIEPGVTAEFNQRGELIGIEILDASQYLPKVIQEKLQPRLKRKVASH
jgi:uncharacterized protein YuzE